MGIGQPAAVALADPDAFQSHKRPFQQGSTLPAQRRTEADSLLHIRRTNSGSRPQIAPTP
jgi:hypothetical protein